MRRARPAFQGRLEGASTSFVLVGSGYGQPMPEPHGAVLPYGASQTPLAPLQLCPLRLSLLASFTVTKAAWRGVQLAVTVTNSYGENAVGEWVWGHGKWEG